MNFLCLSSYFDNDYSVVGDWFLTAYWCRTYNIGRFTKWLICKRLEFYYKSFSPYHCSDQCHLSNCLSVLITIVQFPVSVLFHVTVPITLMCYYRSVYCCVLFHVIVHIKLIYLITLLCCCWCEVNVFSLPLFLILVWFYCQNNWHVVFVLDVIFMLTVMHAYILNLPVCCLYATCQRSLVMHTLSIYWWHQLNLVSMCL